jgi:hypothetical protein
MEKTNVPGMVNYSQELTAASTTSDALDATFKLGQVPCKDFSLQVIGLDAIGAAQVPTAWNAVIEGKNGVDGEWGNILTHQNGDGNETNGQIKGISGVPVTDVRMTLVSVTLGASATKVKITMLGVAR